MENNNKFSNLCNHKEVVIISHRGVWGNNIIQNTYESYLLAKKCGADIVEIDLMPSSDGELYVFHHGYEKILLNLDQELNKVKSKTIDSMELLNTSQKATGKYLEKARAYFQKVKGGGIINIDKTKKYPKEIFKLVDELEMNDEILIKSEPSEEVRQLLLKNKNKYMFMPIIETMDDFNFYDNAEINIVAVEMVFDSMENQILCDASINYFNNRKLPLWANTLSSGKKTLSAWYDDDISILDSPDEGWGALIDKGFKLIQTDYPLLLKNYIENR